MPLTNVTIDDVSALIQYSGVDGVSWIDSPTSDSSLSNYQNQTYHSSQLYRASATFLFDGVAVALYGAKRPSSGSYAVYLDGKYDFNNKGWSATPQFGQLLYSASNLTAGMHNLTYVNTEPSNETYIEIDYIDWTTSMDSSMIETTNQVIPPTPQSMLCSSPTAWLEENDINSTMATSTPGATVTISFTGNGIILNGKTGPNYGPFSVQVDNNHSRTLNAFSQRTHYTVLYREDNLPSGNHTLTVTNRGDGFSGLAVGSATPIIWSSDPNYTAPSSASSIHRLSTAIIAVVIVAIVIGLAALIVFALWFWRRRNRRRAQAEEDAVGQHPQSPHMHARPFFVPSPPRSPLRAHPSRKSDLRLQRGPTHFPEASTSTLPGISFYESYDFGQGPEIRVSQVSSLGENSPANVSSSDVMQNSALSSGNRSKEGVVRTQRSAGTLRDVDAGLLALPHLPPSYSNAGQTLPTLSGLASDQRTDGPPRIPTPRPAHTK